MTENNNQPTYRALYQCRLCGTIFACGDPVSDPEYVTNNLNAVISSMQDNGNAAQMLNVHSCGGIFAGSFALADFLGYEKVSYFRVEEDPDENDDCYLPPVEPNN